MEKIICIKNKTVKNILMGIYIILFEIKVLSINSILLNIKLINESFLEMIIFGVKNLNYKNNMMKLYNVIAYGIKRTRDQVELIIIPDSKTVKRMIYGYGFITLTLVLIYLFFNSFLSKAFFVSYIIIIVMHFILINKTMIIFMIFIDQYLKEKIKFSINEDMIEYTGFHKDIMEYAISIFPLIGINFLGVIALLFYLSPLYVVIFFSRENINVFKSILNIVKFLFMFVFYITVSATYSNLFFKIDIL